MGGRIQKHMIANSIFSTTSVTHTSSSPFLVAMVLHELEKCTERGLPRAMLEISISHRRKIIILNAVRLLQKVPLRREDLDVYANTALFIENGLRVQRKSGQKYT